MDNNTSLGTSKNHYLHIYKASAGSGKTFTLAVNFIRLLIEHPDNYRHILAVTFTNKATAEMKQRILGKLYGIAHSLPDSEAYFNEVQRATGMAEGLIRQRASQALSMLIHDYSHFRVETIDSFFQSVLRGLARELNLGTGMTIELDTKRVISEGVDLLLRELSIDDPTLQWIVNYIGSEIDEGKHWNITDSLKNFARNIHDESYQQQADNLRTQLQDADIIRALRKQLTAERERAKKAIDMQVESFFHLLDNHALTVDEISYGASGVCGYYLKLRDGEYNTPFTSRTTDASLKPEAWASAKSPRRKEIIALAADTLMPHLLATEQLRTREVSTINTCDLVLRHLYQLQLINVVHDRILQLNRDENRFLLADTCRMLSQMQSGDSAFVFEKLGYYIRHIMIDEFQDTSRMQWNNFLHLLREGLSEGHESMLVGDVKQAIYRWRGSDWRILNGEVNRELSLYTPRDTHRLSMNRRSMREVVEFNNHLFDRCNTLLTDLLGEEHASPLIHAYSDVAQEHKEPREGYVRVADVAHEKGEDADEAMCAEVLRTIEELLASGVSESHIALLLRTNTQIQRIVDYMAIHAPTIHIFSADAYRLDASVSVNMLVDTLRWIADSEQCVALLQVAIHYHHTVLADGLPTASIIARRAQGYGLPDALTTQRDTLLQMPLYELTEQLYRTLELQRIAGEDGYLMAFFDHLSQFCTTQAGGIKEFIHYWDDELRSKSIPSGGADGIEAMTVHKSKGLEFHTVIIPYCEWELNKHSGILWIAPDKTSPTPLATNPIPYCEIMKHSAFSDAYHEEYLQQIVDSYNLLYVACTRPKANLIILKSATKSTIAKGKTMNNVAQLITGALGSNADGVLEYGTLSIPTPPSVDATTEAVNPLEASSRPISVTMCSNELRVPFRQSNLAKRFIAQSTTDQEPIANGQEPKANSQQPPLSPLDRGLLLHELFAMIRTADDVPTAIARMVREGIIPATYQPEIEHIVQRALTHPQAADWFSGRYELFNECTILYRADDGTVSRMRPDRVMSDGERFIVVDFKFARERDEHHEQVQSYINRLHEMGHPHVEGYLWYVYENRIVAPQPSPLKVCANRTQNQACLNYAEVQPKLNNAVVNPQPINP